MSTNNRKEPGQILLVPAMQKSGSGWYFLMVRDMFAAAGKSDPRELGKRYDLEKVHKDFQGNIFARPTRRKVRLLEQVRLDGHTFPAKTHWGPMPVFREMIDGGKMKAVYTFRDLRDVVVAAYEIGVRYRAQGKNERNTKFGMWRSFSRLKTVNKTIRWAEKTLMPRWLEWTEYSRQSDRVITVNYADLLASPVKQLQRAADLAELSLPTSKLEEIVDHYDKEKQKKKKNPSLHFNKGTTGRHKESLTPEQLEKCNRKFRPFLEQMGLP